MNSRQKKKLVKLALFLAALSLVLLVNGTAIYSSLSSKRNDYQGYNLEQPWFDGKPWAWFLDMVDQPSLKPQEEGMMQRFPEYSVPRSGREIHIPASALTGSALTRDVFPKNPTLPTAASIQRGAQLYGTFCAACHGADGLGKTKVAERGLPVIAISELRVSLSEAHLYNKIRYGGPIMPAYDYQVPRHERWHLVNYLKSNSFGKGQE